MLLKVFLLLGCVALIPSSAIQCTGAKPGDEECENGNSCSTLFVVDTSSMAQLMERHRTGKHKCGKDSATGCIHALESALLTITCSCDTDHCNHDGGWKSEIEKIIQPYRQKLLVQQTQGKFQWTPRPQWTTSLTWSLLYNGTTLVYNHYTIPSSTSALGTTDDPLKDLFWTHCEVIAILLNYFGMASIGFVLLTLLFTYECVWKERCCGKYRKKNDIEANLRGAADGAVNRRPVLKARRRLNKALPPQITQVEPPKDKEETHLIPV